MSHTERQDVTYYSGHVIEVNGKRYAPERTFRAIYDGEDTGHEFPGKSWHCSNCGHEMDEYEAKCGCYCMMCGEKLEDE